MAETYRTFALHSRHFHDESLCVSGPGTRRSGRSSCSNEAAEQYQDCRRIRLGEQSLSDKNNGWEHPDRLYNVNDSRRIFEVYRK